MKSILLLILVCSGLAVQAQSGLDAFLSTSSKTGTWQDEKAKLNSFIRSLEPSTGTDQKDLRKVFRRVHASFLKDYFAHARFDEVFTDGRFDCLTATALFTHVLTELNYNYEIIETNYHIFLMVSTSGGRVLLETTDRFGGLVTDEKGIATRLADYKKNLLTADASDRTYRYSFNIFQTITDEKLVGLMHFNRAVDAYNHRAWLESALSLESAHALYASERCEELGAILLQTVIETPMDEKAKAECLRHLGGFWLKRSEIFAAN